MTRTIGFTLALAIAASAVPAASKSDPIVVSGETVGASLSRDLDRQIDAATRFARNSHGDGYAVLNFQRGEDGRPTNITFQRRSGVFSVDRLARTAVRRLGSDRGLPDTGLANQQFQANIVLATSQRSYDVLAADLARSERRRLASSSSDRKVIAIAGASRIAS